MAPTRRSRVSFRKANLNASGSRNQNISRMIQRALDRNLELKVTDFVIGQSTGTTPTFLALTQPIVEGIVGTQRIGDNIRLKKVSLRFFVTVSNSSVNRTTQFRFILFLDKQNVGVLPTIGELLANGADLTSGYSTEQIKEKRFHILYDRDQVLSLTGPSGVSVQKEFRLNNTVYYRGTTNAVASNGKNSLYCCFFSDDNTFPPSINANVEILYTDA
jgi:hypothetical protein